MKTTITISRLAALILCSSLLFTSCKNDTALDNLKNTPTAAAFKALRATALADITQHKTFEAADGVTFTSAKGAVVTIAPNCIQTAAGDAATGTATLSFVEMYDRGNMVLTNKSLMCKDSNGDLLPLVTEGQYNLRLTQGTNNLKSGCYFNITVPAVHTGGIDNDMKLWTGTVDENDNIIWDENKGGKEGLGINDISTSYNIWDNTFGWTNIDRFYADTRPKTKIKVAVPTGYNNTNAAVYPAYEGEPKVLAQLDVYNTADKYFSEHYGFIPVDMNVHLIFVSENNGSVAYTIKKVKIAANAIISIADAEIKIATKEQLIALINNLD